MNSPASREPLEPSLVKPLRRTPFAARAVANAIALAALCAATPPPQELSITGAKECEEATTVVLEARWPAASEVTWTWTQVRGPKAKLSSAGATTSFSAPQALADYELEFECRAQAGALVRNVRHVVKVRADDDPPLAQTFVTTEAECGWVLLLTGQGQNPEILQGITYQWRQVGEGPHVALEYADRPQAWCTPPEQGEGYKLEFEFAVSDGVNPETVRKVEVEIACDARFAPLAPEQVLELPRGAFIETPLPRGSWVLRGVLHVAPEADDKPAVVTLRMPTTRTTAAAVNFEAREGHGHVRRYGMERDAQGQWKEPHMSGNVDLGVWELAKPLGVEIGWNGFELAVRTGEPGKRESWSEPPYPVDLKLNSRPRSLFFDVTGAKLTIDALELRGK